jgi:uncharacterized membrane protein YecN with MAPEG domain
VAGKLFMTFAWRFSIVVADKKGKKDIVDGAHFKNCHAAQLNDAEYAPIFVATLLFLHSNSVAAPLASTFAAMGSVAYLWGKMCLPFPAQVPGASLRYLSLIMIVRELCALVF